MSFILYKDDILRNKAIINWDTTNTSFIRIAMVLKRMGIQNYYFFLSLLQPDLVNVDPYSKDLDDLTKTKILLECKYNPWYFFRECLKVPASGGEVTDFTLSRGNLAAIWAFLNDIDFGLIMPRQTGKTYVSQSIIDYMLYILSDHITIAHFDKDGTNCVNIIRTVKELRNGMPKWMYEKSAADTDRKESISYAKKQNVYLTFPSPTDERDAYKKGRGLQLAAIHFDEIAFINYNWIIVPTATNSMLAAAEQSRKAGIPAPIIYTTTAGNPDTRMGRYALDIFEAACPFNEKFYDFKDRDEMLEIVRKNSLHPERPMLYLEFSYRQLGKTDAWFRAAAAKMGANKDDIARDLLNIWQASTDKAVLSPEMIEKIRNSKRTPSHTEIADGFIINWYVDESIVSTDRFQRRPLVMGMDTSENVGRDYTTFTIIDPSTMNLVATCRCNETNLMQIGRQVFQMLEKYTGLVFIPERNNTGIAIIDFVIEELQKHHINPFFRIYNEVIQNYDDPKYKNIDVYNYSEIFGRVRSSFGFRTSGSATSTQGSRNLLFKTVMMKALEMNSSRIFDRQLINEFCTLEVRNGRIDHPEGGHDDQVVSFLLACYLIYFGRNLQMYGIPLNTVLSDVTIAGATVDPAVRQEQVEYKKRIAELEDLINRSPNFLLKQSYLRELSNLQSLVDDEIVTVQPMAVSQVKAQEQEIQKPNEGMNNLRDFVGALRRFNQPMRMPDNSRSHML